MAQQPERPQRGHWEFLNVKDGSTISHKARIEDARDKVMSRWHDLVSQETQDIFLEVLEGNAKVLRRIAKAETTYELY